MLALTKAIQGELQTALQEGDPSLTALLCKELTKTVQLMLSKVEGMVLVSQDARSLTSANGFARTQAQTHNANLLALLVQFKEALLRIPDQLQVARSDAAVGEEGGSAGGRGREAAHTAVLSAAKMIEDLAQGQIVAPVVTLIGSYVTSVAVTLISEGAVSAPSPAPSPAATPAAAGNLGGYTGKVPQVPGTPLDASALECSSAVQTLLRNLPTLLRAQMLNLPLWVRVRVRVRRQFPSHNSNHFRTRAPNDILSRGK